MRLFEFIWPQYDGKTNKYEIDYGESYPKNTRQAEAQNAKPPTNEYAKVMLIAQMNEKYKRCQGLHIEDMSCWAHFKFNSKQPSFKVHVWEIFDEASLDSKTFETFFEKIFEKLSDVY